MSNCKYGILLDRKILGPSPDHTIEVQWELFWSMISQSKVFKYRIEDEVLNICRNGSNKSEITALRSYKFY